MAALGVFCNAYTRSPAWLNCDRLSADPPVVASGANRVPAAVARRALAEPENGVFRRAVPADDAEEMTSYPVSTSANAEPPSASRLDVHLSNPEPNHMSANSTTLLSWFQSHITGLYALPASNTHSDTDSDIDSRRQAFDLAFNSTFSNKTIIHVDDEPVDLAKFKDDVAAAKFAALSIDVDWSDDVKVEPDNANGGTISGSYNVTRRLKFRIRAAPAVRKTKINFTAKISPTPSASNSTDTPNWRIVSFSETVEDATPPITLRKVRSH